MMNNLLLIVIFLLNIIDYCQTMYAVGVFGLSVEANPIARYLLDNDIGAFCKLVIVPLLLFIIGRIVKHERWLSWVIYALLAWYIYIIINNFIVLAQLQLI